MFEGTRLIAALREIAGSPKIEDLSVDFTAVAVDLLRQREVWLRAGRHVGCDPRVVRDPGLFTPHMIHGRALVDGGLLAPLPIAATRLSDAHRLIAVDMHGWPQRPPGEPAEDDAPSGPTPNHRSWLTAWMHTRATDASADAARVRLGFTDLMARSLDTMQAQIARVQLALDPPELVIRIPRDACQFYEFWRAKELIEIGRHEADKALDAAGYGSQPVR